MRISAIDDFDVIRANIQRIRAESVPHCPANAGRLLYDCLRSPAQCPLECPHRADWIGPPAVDHNDCCD